MGPGGRLLYPTGYATLGYGLPAAIGAKIADPTGPVIALVGDAAAMFSIQELVTATELKLPIPVVVVDNGGYQRSASRWPTAGSPPWASTSIAPHWLALAESIGAHGVATEHVADLGMLAVAALAADRPTLIHHAVG